MKSILLMAGMLVAVAVGPAQAVECPAFPADDCSEAVKKSKLNIKANGNWGFSFIKGEVDSGAVGDPTDDVDYIACLYDDVEPTLVWSSQAPAGDGWTALNNGSLRYQAEGPGLEKASIKPGDIKGKITVKGSKGAPLPLDADDAVTFQWHNSAGACWSATYRSSDGTVKKAEESKFIGLAKGPTSPPPPPPCGNGVLDDGEEVDPPPGPFASAPVDAESCRYDFSNVQQLYCNGSCTWGGVSYCDQADADIFCKLKMDNPNSTATNFNIVTALDEPGFACSNSGYGVSLGNPFRGVSSNGNPVTYQDSSILANHGPGEVVTGVVCTDP